MALQQEVVNLFCEMRDTLIDQQVTLQKISDLLAKAFPQGRTTFAAIALLVPGVIVEQDFGGSPLFSAVIVNDGAGAINFSVNDRVGIYGTLNATENMPVNMGIALIRYIYVVAPLAAANVRIFGVY